MIRVAAALLLVLTVGSTAVAGQIYGALFQDNQPLGGAHLKLSCGNDVIEGDTGPDGVYRLSDWEIEDVQPW